ncbi:endoglucanase 24, partial [Olea europaea subsp. europaea]
GHQGAYSDNQNIRECACPFYCDFDGYQASILLNHCDELLWGAAWLRRASQGDSYLNYIQNNGKTLGVEDNINEFGWDKEHAGLNILVSKEVLERGASLTTLGQPGGYVAPPYWVFVQGIVHLVFPNVGREQVHPRVIQSISR